MRRPADQSPMSEMGARNGSPTRQKRIDYVNSAALRLEKTSQAQRRGSRNAEHDRSWIARGSSPLYMLWLVVTTRLPCGAWRTRCRFGSPDFRCAWTDKADADRHSSSFLSARV